MPLISLSLLGLTLPPRSSHPRIIVNLVDCDPPHSLDIYLGEEERIWALYTAA